MSRCLIFLIATILIVNSTALGQTATGILQGRVTDDSGAAVPDARVNIENERTAVRQVTTSNSLGNCRICRSRSVIGCSTRSWCFEALRSTAPLVVSKLSACAQMLYFPAGRGGK